jgi:sugar phosphate isomerase/epimerase
LLDKNEIKFLGSLWYKELVNPYESLNRTVLAGFDGAEISIEYPLLDEHELDISALTDFSSKYRLGVHLPWRDVNLATPIPEIREGTFKYIKRVVSLLDRADPDYYVLHVTTASLECRHSLRCIKIAADILTRLSKEAGARIIVETTSGPCCGNMSSIGMLIEETEEIGVCLDIAQLLAEVFREGKEDWDKTVDTIIESLPPNIWERVELAHIHGWEVRGRKIIPHRYPSPEQMPALRKFLRSIINRTKKLVAVLEVFYDLRGEPLHAWELAPLLREIAKVL